MSRTTAPWVTRSERLLADGRDIYYYDVAPAPERLGLDERDLPPVATTSEIRYDPLLDQWVVIASHRQGRTFLPPTDECPLCPTREGHHTEIPDSDYQVVVFENRFPSLAGSPEPMEEPVLNGAEPGLVTRRPGVGRCEVVCFTSDHDGAFGTLTPERVRLVLEAWADRTAEIGRLDGVEQVFIFENRGTEIGVTLSHPHGQIYGYPFIPPRTQRVLGSAARHLTRTGESLFERIIRDELAAGVRVVGETPHWVAFVPEAARWPFEVHIYPKRRVPDLPALDEDEREEFPALYLDVLSRFDALFGVSMPYIAAWQQAPVHEGRDLAHLSLQIFSIRRAPGKLKYLAGSESGAGVWINDIAPETAAQLLRDARPGGPDH